MSRLARLAVLGVVVSGALMQVADAGVIFGEPFTPADIPAPVSGNPAGSANGPATFNLGEPVVATPMPSVPVQTPLHIQLGQPLVQNVPTPTIPANTPLHVQLGQPLVQSAPTPVVSDSGAPHIEF
jgi:hypothetical protein